MVAGRDADGRLEVFALDALSREVRHLWQTNLLGGWSDWGSLGHGPAAGLASAANADGRLEAFGVDEADHLAHCWQRQTNASTDWTEWVSLGGAILPGLGLGQDEDGRLEVFAVGASSQNYVPAPGASRGWGQRSLAALDQSWGKPQARNSSRTKCRRKIGDFWASRVMALLSDTVSRSGVMRTDGWYGGTWMPPCSPSR